MFYFVMVSGALVAIVGHLFEPAHGRDSALWWPFLALFVFILIRPRTLATDAAGIASYALYGLRRTFIPWTDVSRVSSDWEEESFLSKGVRWITGYSLTVTARSGESVKHDIENKSQAKFLNVLREHVPANRFDPGLYDWHP